MIRRNYWKEVGEIVDVSKVPIKERKENTANKNDNGVPAFTGQVKFSSKEQNIPSQCVHIFTYLRKRRSPCPSDNKRIRR
jgi:hypothetical protein